MIHPTWQVRLQILRGRLLPDIWSRIKSALSLKSRRDRACYGGITYYRYKKSYVGNDVRFFSQVAIDIHNEDILMTRLFTLALTSVLAVQVSASNLFSENFDAMDDTAAKIPGWKFFDNNYSDAGCTVADGTYGPLDLDNRNFITTNSSADPYFRAGLEKGNDNAISGTSMRVYENHYAGAKTCNRIQVFKEFTTGFGANMSYSFTAKMMNQKYATNVAGSKQGMFVKVLDVANGYSETLRKYVPIDPPATAAEQEVLFTIPDISKYGGGAILQIGFYAEGPGNQASGAMWDDVSVDEWSPTLPSGGSSGPQAAPSKIPTLPLGGVLGLIGMMAWLGLRRKR